MHSAHAKDAVTERELTELQPLTVVNESDDDVTDRDRVAPESLHVSKQPDADVPSTAPSIQPPDGGYGWVIVVAGIVNSAISVGTFKAFAFLYAELINILEKSALEVAGIASLWMALYTLFGPVAGILMQRYGVRKMALLGSIVSSIGMLLSSFPVSLPYLYVTIPVFCGVGRSFILMSTVLIPTLYFTKKKARAVGLVSLGASLGTLIYPTLTATLLDQYGYRGCMLILSAISFNQIACCALYRPLQSQTIQTNQYKDKKASCLRLRRRTSQDIDDCIKSETDPVVSSAELALQKAEDQKCNQGKVGLRTRLKMMRRDISHGVLGNGIFWSFSIFALCFAFCQPIVGTFITALATQDIGVSQFQISTILTTSGVTDGVARISSGFLYDWKYVRSWRTLLSAMTGMLMGGGVVLIGTLSNGLASLAGFYHLLAFIWGSLTAQFITVLSDIVGRTDTPKALGITVFIAGIGFFTGPFVGGAIRDAVGNYSGSFIMGGVVMTTGCFIYVLVYVIRKNKDMKGLEEKPRVLTMEDTKPHCEENL